MGADILVPVVVICCRPCAVHVPAVTSCFRGAAKIIFLTSWFDDFVRHFHEFKLFVFPWHPSDVSICIYVFCQHRFIQLSMYIYFVIIRFITLYKFTPNCHQSMFRPSWNFYFLRDFILTFIIVCDITEYHFTILFILTYYLYILI